MKLVNKYYSEKKLILSFGLIGLLLLVFLSIVNKTRYGASLSVVLIPSSILVLSGFFSFKYPQKIKADYYLIFVFWLEFFVSTILSNRVPLQRDIATLLVMSFVYFFSVSLNFSNKQLKFVFIIYEIVALYCASNIIFNYFSGNWIDQFYRRASFTFLGMQKDPNYTTAFIGPVIFLNTYKIICHKNQPAWKVGFWIVSVILMFVACVFTGSRGGLTSIIVSFFVSFLASKKNSILKKTLLALFTVVLFALMYFIFSSVLKTQVFDRFFNLTSDSRLDLWESALSVFYDSPIIGGGMGAASYASRTSVGNYSHNVYIDILCDSGIIGLTTFVFFFFKNCFRSNSKVAGIHIGLVVSFMMPLFFINGFNTATFFLPIILLTFLSSKYRRGADFNDIFG